MTQVEYKIKLGKDEFTLRLDVQNSVEFFEKLSFYSNLPKTGPNGEDDLKITHRTTTQGYNYYSLVSEKAGMEYKFGQPKEDPKVLYGKGWEPLFRGNDSQQQSSAPAQFAMPTPVQPQQFTPPPVQQQAPVPQFVAPAQVQQAPQQVAPQANPQVQQVASNVLARFGINK
jgi:hypothetical protein